MVIPIMASLVSLTAAALSRNLVSHMKDAKPSRNKNHTKTKDSANPFSFLPEILQMVRQPHTAHQVYEESK